MNLSVAKSNLSNNCGFSLVEIAIVIMIIGGILTLALPRMSFNKMDNRKVFREFVISVKEIRNRAKLYNATYRMAFKLTENDQSYWVEKSTAITLLDTEKLKKEREQTEQNALQNKEAPASPFEPDTSYMKAPRTLPEGYIIKAVESGPQDMIFTDGVAYIHFFPQGMIEPALIQLQDPKKNIWTLVFNPITGQADIIDGAKSLKDLNR